MTVGNRYSFPMLCNALIGILENCCYDVWWLLSLNPSAAELSWLCVLEQLHCVAYSSCFLCAEVDLIFIFIDFKKIFLWSKSVFVSAYCIVFLMAMMLCLHSWNCLLEIAFKRREYFPSFLWYLWLWWRHLEGHWCYIYLSTVEAIIAFAIVDVHFNSFCLSVSVCWLISVFSVNKSVIRMHFKFYL